MAIAMPFSESKATHPYDIPDLYEIWWRYLSGKYALVCRRDDLLVHCKQLGKGLLLLKEARIAGWEIAWFQDLTEERVNGLLQLQEESGWDYFRITWCESRQDQQQFQLFKQAGYPMLKLPFEPQHLIDLQGGMEGYLSRLGRQRRQDLKRRVRRAQPLNPKLIVITEESEIAPFFGELFAHHIAYWTEKAGRSYFSDSRERDFTVSWAKALYRSGHLQLTRFILDGQTVNLRVGTVFGKTAYASMTVNTGEYREYTPGVLSLYARLEILAAQGVQSCNLGTGKNTYKAEYTNRLEPAWETVVLNPNSMKAKAYQQWLRIKHPNLEVLS